MISLTNFPFSFLCRHFTIGNSVWYNNTKQWKRLQLLGLFETWMYKFLLQNALLQFYSLQNNGFQE